MSAMFESIIRSQESSTIERLAELAYALDWLEASKWAGRAGAELSQRENQESSNEH